MPKNEAKMVASRPQKRKIDLSLMRADARFLESVIIIDLHGIENTWSN